LNTKMLALAAAAALIISGCGKQATNLSTLPQKHVNAKLDPIPSTVTVPVTLSASWLEQQINNATQGVIFSDDSITVIAGFSRAGVNVTKTEPIRVAVTGTTFAYQLPMSLNLKLSTGLFGREVVQEVRGGLKVRMSTSMVINPDWSVTTKTAFEGYEWTTAPQAQLGPVTVPFKPVADIVLAGLKVGLGPTIDKMVKSKLDLKKILTPLWTQMQSPQLLDKKNNVWLRLTPDQVLMTPLTGKGQSVTTILGMRTLAECFVGSALTTNPVKPLPKLTTATPDTGFILNLNAEISYVEAQKLAREAVIGKSFPAGKKSITVDTLWVNGDTGLVKIDVALSGDYKGTITLLGRPQLDTLSQVLTVQDISFDLKSRSILLKSAKWMFGGIIEKKLAEALTIPLKPQFTTLQTQINSTLKEYKPQPDIKVTGLVSAITPRGLALTPTGMKIGATAKGKLAVDLTKATD